MEAFLWALGVREIIRCIGGDAVPDCLEAWYLQILMLVARLLKNPKIAFDALSVCMGINGLLFIVSVGFNAAARELEVSSIRCGNGGFGLFYIVAVVEAMEILSLRHVICYAFTSGEMVANTVSELCPFLAFTLILKGIQPVLSGNAFLLS
ncbi:hypothetical protein RHMOL_Rhmol02G0118900 [Rhododendron molle]|uniref:Uncharacterized protein n=1 Tax=Rhododendron molle TaxID=49168 RepID=A0ACC0PS88_RHOML|nr:hypothetical protein RHMOL_Rhmol02G0118900 [Rhododendron molle]